MHADATWTIWGVWLVHANQAMDNCHCSVISVPVSVTIWTTEPIKLLQLSIQNSIRTTATCWLGHQSCKDLLIHDHFSPWTVVLIEVSGFSIQAMDKCHLLIMSSVFQWAVFSEQQDQSACCSRPFKTRYGQLHQSGCCKDLLTQDHLSLWIMRSIGVSGLSMQIKPWTTATCW